MRNGKFTITSKLNLYFPALAGQVFLPALLTAGLAAAGAAAGAAGLVGTGLAAEAAEAGTEENSEGIQQLCRSAGKLYIFPDLKGAL